MANENAKNEATIYAKLSKIQASLIAPKKQEKGMRFKARSAEEILSAVKPFLAETGTAITMTDSLVQMGDRIYVKAVATIWDSVTGQMTFCEALAREPEQMPGCSVSQATGSTSSYARKYALQGLLALSDATEDPDKMQAPSPQEQPRQQPQAQAPRQQAQRPAAQQAPKQQPKAQQPQAQQPSRVEQVFASAHTEGRTEIRMEELTAAARLDRREKIAAIIAKYPDKRLEEQAKKQYKVDTLELLTPGAEMNLLHDLEKCDAAWSAKEAS